MPQELPMELGCREAKTALDADPQIALLDCRERDEHDVAHITGATLLPMSEIVARAAELEPLKARRIIVHCHHGGRSLRVAAWLRGQGYSAQSMAGGIDAWSVEIDPSVPRY